MIPDKLRGHKRVVLVGGPHSGKTTMAAELGRPAKHTDDLIGAGDWSAVSEQASTWFDETGDWVVEGVATARAIRKWLAREAGSFPAVILVIRGAHDQLVKGQESMRKGVETVWAEIEPELVRRGTTIIYHDISPEWR